MSARGWWWWSSHRCFFVWGCDILIKLLGILRWSHHTQEDIFKKCFHNRMSCSHTTVECIVNSSEPQKISCSFVTAHQRSMIMKFDKYDQFYDGHTYINN
jgi:hypothetical protein